MNPDGSMARGSDLAKFCSEYGFTMVTVAQLVRYRLETELDRPPGCLHPGHLGQVRTGEIVRGGCDAHKFTYWRPEMSDIVAERSGNILSIQLNRPTKKNAMTSSMYVTMAELLNGAAKDDQIRVVLWHAAGNSFSAGNDIEDFVKNPPHQAKALSRN